MFRGPEAERLYQKRKLPEGYSYRAAAFCSAPPAPNQSAIAPVYHGPTNEIGYGNTVIAEASLPGALLGLLFLKVPTKGARCLASGG